MNLYLTFQFFILGLTTSLSFCWTFCTPIFFIATSISELKFKNFVSIILKYTTVKFITQIFLVLFIYFILDKMFSKTISKFSLIANLFFGITFLYFGFSKIFQISKNNEKTLKTKNILSVLSGFFSGLNLCLPKILVFGYVFTKSNNNISELLLYITSFTIGEIFSPILIISFLINFLKEKTGNINKKLKHLFVYVGATIFIIFGLINIIYVTTNFLKKI